MLSVEQVKHIAQAVADEGITRRLLYDDLVDHLCCSTETAMRDGDSFEQALSKAISDLGTLQRIDFETSYLLNPIQIIMKKFVYFIGLATTISMTMGVMFKLLHMRGGEQLFNYGFLTFLLVFLPAVVFYKFRNKNMSGIERAQSLVGVLSAVGVGAAVVLKIFSQLDPSGVFLLVSVSIFCFVFLPLKFYTLYRESLRAEA
ncbi:MAG: hypothetical protein HC859_03855 [Bacteroidia bacterium]|nr:hypothetical protein [Bacteroidia bacterium]